MTVLAGGDSKDGGGDTPPRPGRPTTGGGAPGGGSDPVAAAAAAESAAATRLQRAEAAVTVASAKLAEAVAKAPPHGPILQRALDAADAATAGVVAARAAVTTGERAVADTAGAVLVAAAQREDLDSSTSVVTRGQIVAADEVIARRVRAATAAQGGLNAAVRAADAAQETAESAQGALVDARRDPDVTPWQIVAAQENIRGAQQARQSEQGQYEAAKAAHAAVRARANAGDPTAQATRQHFYDLEEFVVDYVLPNWERRLAADQGPQFRWCARWWEHLEVTTRLGHLWESFEVMRREQAPAMSTFWRDHLDHHMQVITDACGPLQMCDDAGAHQVLPVWRTVPADPGLFPGTDTSETETERRKLIRTHTVAAKQGDKS